MKGNKVNSTFAALLILLVLLGIGFILLREGEALEDTYDYGTGSVQDIKKIDQALERLDEESKSQTP